MDRSKFLGKVVGLYFVIVSLTMLIGMPQFLASVANLADNPSLTFVTGFMTLIIGILMVVAHNVWQMNWRVIVTVIAWITLLKGISILIYPDFVNKTSVSFMQDMTMVYVAAVINLALGVLLCYFGFKR